MRSGGIEPPPTAWKAAMIPFHHERAKKTNTAAATNKLMRFIGKSSVDNSVREMAVEFGRVYELFLPNV